MTTAEIETKLRRIGARRKRHDEEQDAIRAAIEEVLPEARGKVTMEKAADLLGMHRGSLYELYLTNDEKAPA